jgi:hypothetical protein
LEIAAHSPELAAQLATENGISLDFLEGDMRRRGGGDVNELAFNWIRDNPQRAKELADFFVMRVHAQSLTDMLELTHDEGIDNLERAYTSI